MHEGRRARAMAYGLAVLAPAVSLLIRWPLWPWLGDAVPHMTFFPAVMIAAYVGGLWPGLLATLLSALAANYFLTKQLSSLQVKSVNDVAALVLFLLVGAIISGLSESLHRARRQIVAVERRRAEEERRESEQRFRTFLDHATDAFFLHDERHAILDVNRQACESLGYTREELLGMTPSDFDPDVTAAGLNEITRKLSAGETMAFESRHRRKDRTIFPVEVRGRAFWEGGRQFTVALVRDITDRKRDEALLDGQKRILELIIQGEPLADVLTVLCRTIEELAQGEMLASVLLLDADGTHLRHGAAPSLPESYIRAVDGLAIGPSVGSCGTAAYRHEPVFVSDIASDPLWAPFAEFALSHGLRACWSSPIFSNSAEVLGTFAMYYRQPRRPTPRDLRVVDIVTRTVAIAIEQSRAEQALRESEGRFRTLAKATNDAVWDWDLGTNKVWWNEGVFTLFGYTVEQNEATPAWWLERVHPDDRKAVESFFFGVVGGREQSWIDEYRFRCADGSYKDVYDRGYVLRDADGRAVRMIGAMLDITGRKRAERALRESEHRWRSLTEALPQLVWTATPDGACDYFSTQWTDYTGILESELLGWRWLETLNPDDREATRQAWTAAVQGPGAYDVEYRVRRFDGEYRWFKTRGVPIRDSEGGIFKWFGTCTDITDAKLAEEELRLAKEAAESANRAKDEFLANVSHEIRTPMNAILGMTELTLDTSLTDDQRQCLQTVKSAADNLLGIINDLLDFSKIEAGKLELDSSDFSLRAAVGDTLRALAVRAHKKGLELVCHVEPDVPDALIGDAGRLRQILLNLAGNAIKFTDDGEVVVRAEFADDSEPEEDVALRFTVRDTGIGIPKDRREKIFQAFEQEDTSTTRKYGGTGLGLTIAARLVALMGGQITVESEPGRGSTFAFTARFARQPHSWEQAPIQPPVLLHNLPVLIVDDNATNRRILEEWFRGWQMKAVAVGDGVSAIDALWHGTASGRPYPLVLLDARMPDVDGLALATQIRQRAELSATRIILLTSGDRPGDVARFREQRVSAHLLKPVQQDDLLETIYRVMSGTNGNAPPAAMPAWRPEPVGSAVPAATPLRILVAEDNEFNAVLLEQLLARRGHRVRVANNGRIALSLSEKGVFDLLLLDVHMPELDGFQVIQAIREREQNAGGHLPVVALTARSREEDRERCLAAGMDDFLAKPIQAADLWAAIERVIRKDEGGRMKDENDRTPNSDSSFILHPSSFGKGLLDARVLLAACGGDAVILEKICDAFRARLPDQLTAVQAALQERDVVRLREAAHKISGVVAAFSTLAGSVASDLEDRASQGQLEECRPLVEKLDTMARELIEHVRNLSLETLQQQAFEIG